MYSSDDLYLRRVEAVDVPILLEWENDQENWKISDRSEPLSFSDIQALITSQEGAVFDLDQVRFMIVEGKTNVPIGTIDLYEISWSSDEAYVGILIADKSKRRKGAALISLMKLESIARKELELEKLLARVHMTNKGSQELFKKARFRKKIENLNPQNSEPEYIDCDIFEKWLNE